MSDSAPDEYSLTRNLIIEIFGEEKEQQESVTSLGSTIDTTEDLDHDGLEYDDALDQLLDLEGIEEEIFIEELSTSEDIKPPIIQTPKIVIPEAKTTKKAKKLKNRATSHKRLGKIVKPGKDSDDVFLKKEKKSKTVRKKKGSKRKKSKGNVGLDLDAIVQPPAPKQAKEPKINLRATPLRLNDRVAASALRNSLLRDLDEGVIYNNPWRGDAENIDSLRETLTTDITELRTITESDKFNNPYGLRDLNSADIDQELAYLQSPREVLEKPEKQNNNDIQSIEDTETPRRPRISTLALIKADANGVQYEQQNRWFFRVQNNLPKPRAFTHVEKKYKLSNGTYIDWDAKFTEEEEF